MEMDACCERWSYVRKYQFAVAVCSFFVTNGIGYFADFHRANNEIRKGIYQKI